MLTINKQHLSEIYLYKELLLNAVKTINNFDKLPHFSDFLSWCQMNHEDIYKNNIQYINLQPYNVLDLNSLDSEKNYEQYREICELVIFDIFNCYNVYTQYFFNEICWGNKNYSYTYAESKFYEKIISQLIDLLNDILVEHESKIYIVYKFIFNNLCTLNEFILHTTCISKLQDLRISFENQDFT